MRNALDPICWLSQGVIARMIMLVVGLSTATWVNATGLYVSVDGRDTATGTEQSPWRTIQHAADRAEPGDTVYIRRGIYREHVAIRRSGSARSGAITIRNYPAEKPIVSGRGLTIPNGQHGLIDIANQDFIRVRGLTLSHYTSTDSAVPIGIYIHGHGRHIELIENHISRIETRMTGCDANAFGIAVYGSHAHRAIRQLTITGNEVAHLRTGCSESVAVNGNVTDFEISHNLIHDNNNIGIDIIGYEGTAPDPATDVARNGVIADNTIYNISSYDNNAYPGRTLAAGGIYVDGGKNIVIERNFVYDNDIGIELASEQPNRDTRAVTVRRNKIWNNRTTGLSIGGYAAGRGGTVDCEIVYNSFYKNDTHHTYGGELQIQYNARRNVFKHNTMTANEQMVYINNYVDSTARPVDTDHNRYYSENARTAGEWQWRGKNYDGFERYRYATDNDPGSSFGWRRQVRVSKRFAGLVAARGE